ncbi:MAG: ribosomal subunit interface protein [Proteobacteria bacterium]|nr:MAG: ribosomal subunit interface protein [Pseudomonadota bacterium]
MNMSIVGKQFELTDAIKDYISNGIDSLNKYNLDIISARALVSADEKKGKKGFTIDFTINLAHLNTIVIKQKDKDLYAAIDLAIDRAKKVLRRHHDKTISSRNKSEENLGETFKEENKEHEEIVPMELELYKPMEIEEALEKLKSSDMQFFVFNDIDAKMRVLYKRTDGTFGLY